MAEKLYEIIRRDFGAGDKERDKNEKTPEDIERFDNIRYGDHPVFNVLDVYRPKNKKGEKLPVIVSVHGGAFVYGSKEVYQYYCMKLAQKGYAVVNFSYRLAPEFKYPAPLFDLKEVYEWMLYNKDEYGFDLNNTFAVGDSAGAHILGLYAGVATNYKASEKFGIAHSEDVRIKGIALNCGKFILDKNDELSGYSGEELYAYVFENGGTQEELDMFDVTEYVTPNYPRTFIMTCQGDFLKSQAKSMVFKLEDNNVPFEYHLYGNSNNKLWHVFHCHPTLKDAVLCNEEECDFFKRCIN